MAQKHQVSKVELIVIGGSSGSLEAIIKILAHLNTAFSIPIVIIPHRAKNADASLELLLSAKTALMVKEATQKEIISAGFIYVAPPDYHLLIEGDHSFSLDSTEKVKFSRPSIDVSFQSAAAVYGANLLAIVLSGANADGALGAQAVINSGGTVLIQDPTEAAVAYMPWYAIKQIKATQGYTCHKIAEYLNKI